MELPVVRENRSSVTLFDLYKSSRVGRGGENRGVNTRGAEVTTGERGIL